MNKNFAPINFLLPSHIVAQQLIGSTFLFRGVGGIIVETEAYDQTDPASHSFGGCTPRNTVMFGPPETIYVYCSYGIHWCFNFVCGKEKHGSAVLIRAIEPTHGIEIMQERRKMTDLKLLCAGPGRAAQALDLTKQENGLSIRSAECTLIPRPNPVRIITGSRIGISKAKEVPWRFGFAYSPFLSRSFSKESQLIQSE